jgi:neopullulanase
MPFIKTVFLLFILLLQYQVSAQKPVINKVEPPNWWTGMKLNRIQLMLYGENLKDVSIHFEPAGIKVLSVDETEKGLYSFINIEIPSDAQPQTYKIIVEKKGRKTQKEFSLLKRETGIRHQGFSSEDVIYLIMPDRFANGSKNNDNTAGFIDSLNRQKLDGRHGGDIQGIIDNLPYLKNLGVTTLWLTPLVENNTPMSYHGYGATDFYRIDPRIGSNELYKLLVTEAHKHSLKIIMDHVANHFHKNHPWMKNLPVPEWIHGTLENHLSANHNKMVFNDPYGDTLAIKKVSEGWFTDYLADLNQANTYVSNYIIQNTIWWIEFTGLDGIREDTYPYADQKFLSRWAKVILEEYPNLNIVGEVWTGEPAFLSTFQKGSTVRGYDSNLPSVTDFGVRDRYYDFLRGAGKLFNIYETFTKDYLYPDPGSLVTFIDNHDVSRGLFYAKGDINRMKIALLILLTTRGIPQLFYGTETNFVGAEAHGALRFDYPGGFEGDTLNYFTNTGLNEEQKDYFEYLKKLLLLRGEHKSFSSGKFIHFPPENGVYVYFKYNDSEKFMIIVNEKEESQTIELKNFSKYTDSKTITEIFPGKGQSVNESVTIGPVSGNIYKLD